jgi:hypothetical protein
MKLTLIDERGNTYEPEPLTWVVEEALIQVAIDADYNPLGWTMVLDTFSGEIDHTRRRSDGVIILRAER